MRPGADARDGRERYADAPHGTGPLDGSNPFCGFGAFDGGEATGGIGIFERPDGRSSPG